MWLHWHRMLSSFVLDLVSKLVHCLFCMTYFLLEILLIPKAPNQRPFLFLHGISSLFSLDLISVLLIALSGISYLSYLYFICSLPRNSVYWALFDIFVLSTLFITCSGFMSTIFHLSVSWWIRNEPRPSYNLGNFSVPLKSVPIPIPYLCHFLCGWVLLNCTGKLWPTSILLPLGFKACVTKANFPQVLVAIRRMILCDVLVTTDYSYQPFYSL